MRHFRESSVAVVFICIISFIMVNHLAGALDIHTLVVVQDAVVMVDLLPGVGLLRTVGQAPAGFTVHPVFFNVDIPDPVQGGDLQIARGFVAVHPGKDGNDCQQNDGKDHQRLPGTLLRLAADLRLGGQFRRFLFLLFLQTVKIIGFRIFAGGAAVAAELGVVAVEGVAEGTVPVRVFADILCLFFRQVLDIGPVIFLTGGTFLHVFQIKFHIPAGPAAGRAVGDVAADFLVSADRAVPVAHHKF